MPFMSFLTDNKSPPVYMQDLKYKNIGISLLLDWPEAPKIAKMMKPAQLIHQQYNDTILIETAVALGLLTWIVSFSYCFSRFCFPEVSRMSVPSLLCSAVWTCLAGAQLKCDPFWWKIQKSQRKSGDNNKK